MFDILIIYILHFEVTVVYLFIRCCLFVFSMKDQLNCISIKIEIIN